MTALRYLPALGKALRDEMAVDPSVFVVGEDVRAALRGVTRGLFEEFGPDRVLDMPISEQMFTGFATGAALTGRRCVVEYQIPSLLYLAFEQIANQAQKLRLMTGGQAKVPVVYLVPGSGARLGLAGQHSDHPYPPFLHAGVKTVLPATAADAYGLMISAIRDDDPVLYLAPAAVLPMRSELADEPEIISIGSGRIHRAGTDVTVVAIGHLVHEAIALADELELEISVEVFDPRTLHPFDWGLLRESLDRTGRLVVFDDSNRTCGLGAEIVATAAEEMRLVARPRRITRADAPIAFAVELEVAALPSRAQLETAVRAVVAESPHKMIDVHIPKAGMSTVEVDVVAVRVAPGEVVEPSTVLLEVESEKATFEVEAGLAGTVREILVREGDEARVGDVVARIEPG